MELAKEIEAKIAQIILQKCEFDTECDFCDDPKHGTFVRTSGYEYHDDFYWICGKCFIGIENRYSKLDDMQLMMKIDKLQEDLPIKLPF